jgi:hypothetical protein
MPTAREKRVYVAQSDTVEAYVAAELGVAVARVSGDKVGEFSLVERCSARDVAATARGVAAATDEDVLVGDADGFAETGFGPAVAVTSYDGGALAAGEDGRVAHHDGDWTTVGTVDADVRALDADLVAAADGVHRLTDDGLAPAGLDDARDVAAAGVPHAATPSGLYHLGNGWMDAVSEDFSVVASDPVTASAGELGRAHAATADALYAHGDGDWHPVDLPVEESVAGVAYAAEAPVVLTTAGTLAVDAGDGFRHRSLGLRDARALAVVAEGNA